MPGQEEIIKNLGYLTGKVESLCNLTEDYILEARRKEEKVDSRLRKAENRIFAIWIIGPVLMGLVTYFTSLKLL